MSSTTLGTSPTFVNGGVSFWYREDKVPARRPAPARRCHCARRGGARTT